VRGIAAAGAGGGGTGAVGGDFGAGARRRKKLRRAARRQRLGLAAEPGWAAGRPLAQWIALFALSHHEAGGAWERAAWPDGRPLLDQSWVTVRVFEAIRDELRIMAAEEARRSARRG
jgi:hypothetical protein